MSRRNGELAQCFRVLRGLHRELERCESGVERSVLRTEIQSEARTLQRHRSEIASRAEAGDESSRTVLELVDRGTESAQADRSGEPDPQSMEQGREPEPAEGARRTDLAPS